MVLFVKPEQQQQQMLPERTYLNFPPELLEDVLLPRPLRLAMLGERQNFTRLLFSLLFR